jgi:hemerythrin-like domain-containing protein
VSAIAAPETTAAQLAAPLAYLTAEHFRHRSLCTVLDGIADEPLPARDMLGAVIRFLRADFRFQVDDEEQDLFPMLRRCADPDDRMDDVLDRLCREHAAEEMDAEAIAQGLADALRTGAPAAPTDAFRDFLHRFAAFKRRHLTLENAIILPLARIRLTPDDLRDLGRRMAARRGI